MPQGRVRRRPGTSRRGGLVVASVLSVAGLLLGQAPSALGQVGQTLTTAGWQVAPGVRYDEWTQAEPQGPVRVHVLTVDTSQPGVTLDQVSSAQASVRAPISQLVAGDGDVAGVNADFFDIDDTGAALGVGVDRQGHLLHAPRSGWNTSFVVEPDGRAVIKQVTLTGDVRSRGRRVVALAGLNAPHLVADSVNLYNSVWGPSPSRSVADGGRGLRQVVVTGGRVRSNRVGPTPGTVITGSVLLGRGSGARALSRLKVGQAVRITKGLSDARAVVAVSGSVQVLRGGAASAPDNGERNPRTAVGIDADHHLVHLVVVDGRSETSSGVTLTQLAALLAGLGDEDGLNLDGGGSSTMVAPDAAGTEGLRNSPSDGHERPVANGLVVHYSAP